MSKKLLLNTFTSPWPKPQNPVRQCTLEARSGGIVEDHDYFIFNLGGGAVYPIAYINKVTLKTHLSSRLHFKLIENTIPTENRLFETAMHYDYNETPQTDAGIAMTTAVKNAILNDDHNDVTTKWYRYADLFNPSELPTTIGVATFAVDQTLGGHIIFQFYIEED